MMANSYTVLWSKERCQQIVKFSQVGRPLTVLFGGPHQSEPRFRRFGVRTGDFLYPVSVSGGVLFLLGRMKVRQLLTIDEYVAAHAATFAGFESPWGAEATFANWLQDHPEQRFLAPTCTEEVALGDQGTPLRLDVAVPADVLERLRFCSTSGERGLKHITGGRLKSVVSLQGGAYRLNEASAKEIEAMLINAPSPHGTNGMIPTRMGLNDDSQS